MVNKRLVYLHYYALLEDFKSIIIIIINQKCMKSNIKSCLGKYSEIEIQFYQSIRFISM